MAPTRVSVIVPTFREVENLPHLLAAVDEVRQQHDLSLELLVMDDDSGDGTEALMAEKKYDWASLHVRKTNRGLSPAVLEGLGKASGEVCIVMDADLSHPPDQIPEMLKEIEAGSDFVIGSRYAPGGTTDSGWGFGRWLNSKIATLLARPFTQVKDPMAGFIAFPRSILGRASSLNPVGYKIGLELLVKCGCRDVREVPIHFADRTRGSSKLNFAEQLKYIRHLRRLAQFCYPNAACLLQFLVVGASGVMVNLWMLTFLLWLHLTIQPAIALAIAASMASNFFINRRFTFSYARGGPMMKQFIGFVGACLIGAVVNFEVAVLALEHIAWVTKPQVASLLGIMAGTAINYFTNRLFVFKGADLSKGVDSSEAETSVCELTAERSSRD